MKKLFISCPMRDRTEENILNSMERMHKLAEIIFNQELEVIPTYIPHAAPENVNRSIWCLGESIKKMAEADYFIGIGCSPVFEGCNVEQEVARRYGITRTNVEIQQFMPDAFDIENKYLADNGVVLY